MKNTVLATALLCLLPLAGSSAEINISAIQLPVDLGQYLEYYEDASGAAGIDSIRAQQSGWERLADPTVSLGISDSSHWFRLELRGEQLAGEELVLIANSPSLDNIDVFFFQHGELVKSARAGDTVPFSQLEHPSRMPVIPFRMSEDGSPTEIFICVSSGSGIQLPLSVSNMALVAQEQQATLAYYGGFFTFFFICLGACLFLFVSLRERLYFGITAFFAGVITIYLSLSGVGRMWFWGETSEFNTRIGYLGACLIVGGLAVIGRTLSFNFRWAESVALVLRFIAFLTIPIALYFLLVPFDQISRANVIPFLLLALVTLFTVFVMIGIKATQGSQAALYMLYSGIMVVISFLWQIAYMFGILDRGSEATYVAGALMIIAALFMLAALAEFARSKSMELATARMETRAKGDFLKNVSREFLTPVHLILANSKRLMAAQSNRLDEGAREHMNTVIKQSDHLHKLINDLLEMAELESNSFEPEFELVEISQFLNEVKELMLPPALEKNIEINTVFSSANLLVQTDKSRLQHSLINLLSNAIRYTESGSITLGYKAIYFRRKLGIEIYIRDTGRGMSPEFQSKVFQEFAREDEQSEKHPGSTGLGLVIVKRIIEKLGGKIVFESERGHGTTFYIRLPLRVQQA